jgi:small subunit ribosomal protein S3Ae
VVSPEIFGSKEIGKTTATDPDYIKGRTITASAMELTDNYNKFYLKFKLRVRGLEGERAITDFDGSECMRDYISRMVLRHVRRIDSVQDLQTSDGIPIRVKTLAIVSRKMKSSMVKIIRRRIQELVKKMVEKNTLGDFVEDMIEDNSKMRVLNDIRKIYPVRNFEFRKTEIIR